MILGHTVNKHMQETVEIQPFHTLFSGQTNLSGKTTAIRALVPQAVEEGYTILIFDTKPTIREFIGYHDSPICYQYSNDPLVLIGLLESIRRSRLSPLYATLGRICEKSATPEDIVTNAEAMEKSAKSGFIKDACYTVKDLMKRLNKELSDIQFSEHLQLKEKTINVMPINKISSEAQQLIVKTSFEELLKHYTKDVIVVIDETWRFLPQDYSSACKRAVQDVITQGAKTHLFVWLATQFLATIDKPPIKGMATKLLGRQDHDTEIQHTIDLIPGGRRLFKPEDIMTLKRGEFIYVPIEGNSTKVYVHPPTETGKPIAVQEEEEDWSDVITRIQRVEEALRV